MKQLKEITIKREICEKEMDVKVSIYASANKAIESKWDSLVFASNDDDFIMVSVGDSYVFEMVTDGEVEIGTQTGIMKNTDYKEISKLALSEDIYDESKYTILSNNWFSLLVKEPAESQNYFETVDDIMFECTPETIEDLIDNVVDMAVDYVTEYNK